jgi:carbamate kinase
MKFFFILEIDGMLRHPPLSARKGAKVQMSLVADGQCVIWCGHGGLAVDFSKEYARGPDATIDQFWSHPL